MKSVDRDQTTELTRLDRGVLIGFMFTTAWPREEAMTTRRKSPKLQFSSTNTTATTTRSRTREQEKENNLTDGRSLSVYRSINQLSRSIWLTSLLTIRLVQREREKERVEWEKRRRTRGDKQINTDICWQKEGAMFVGWFSFVAPTFKSRRVVAVEPFRDNKQIQTSQTAK